MGCHSCMWGCWQRCNKSSEIFYSKIVFEIPPRLMIILWNRIPETCFSTSLSRRRFCLSSLVGFHHVDSCLVSAHSNILQYCVMPSVQCHFDVNKIFHDIEWKQSWSFSRLWMNLDQFTGSILLIFSGSNFRNYDPRCKMTSYFRGICLGTSRRTALYKLFDD